jgi:hypothetical protein
MKFHPRTAISFHSRIFRSLVLLLALSIFLFARTSAANEFCKTLPRVAWTNYEHLNLDYGLLGITKTATPKTVKDLYARAVCGVYPNKFEDAVLRGEGMILAVPSELAGSLDAITPDHPRVDYIYIRGGGRTKELIVILFSNGYQGPLFKVNQAVPWERAEVEEAGSYWNLMPYEFLRVASSYIQDAARYDQSYDVVLEAQFLFGLIRTDIGVFTMKGRGLANPFGSIMAPRRDANGSPTASQGAMFWVHELTHFHNFARSGMRAYFYADDFASISRHNGTFNELLNGTSRILGSPIGKVDNVFLDVLRAFFGGVTVPLAFVQNYKTAEENVSHCTPKRETWRHIHGYVTEYAGCGETVLEDFGDAASVALGVTQGITNTLPSNRPMLFPYESGGEYAESKLYGAFSSAEETRIFEAKAKYLQTVLGVHANGSDADFDGVRYLRSGKRGDSGFDCNDLNPVRGTCAANSCDTVIDCGPAKACEDKACTAGACITNVVDRDGDGDVAIACGGGDCDDSSPLLSSKRTEICGDGIDNDCSGRVDDVSAANTNAPGWYVDNDGDGYGAGSVLRSCVKPSGPYVAQAGDCNDSSARFNPKALESCTSSEDLNCDGRAGGVDADGDGVRGCDGDCNDSNPNVRPGAIEICDGIDNNCNGLVDQNDAAMRDTRVDAACSTGLFGICGTGRGVCVSGGISCSVTQGPRSETCNNLDDDCDGRTDEDLGGTWYRDADGDNFGDPLVSTQACSQPAGYVARAGDCHDGNAAVSPGQARYFTAPYIGTNGRPSFDYDCDGAQVSNDTAVGYCHSGVWGVDVRSGWLSAAAPFCGESAAYAPSPTTVRWSWFTCDILNAETRTQACR